MRDYAQLRTKLVSSIWLITPEGLNVVLDIANKRLNGDRFDEEHMAEFSANAARIKQISAERQMNPYDSYGAHAMNGVGVLPISGPIFGKANMMTEMSGATSLETMMGDFNAMIADDSIQSVLLDIDSPGGTSDMVQEMGDAIFAGRGVKPIHAIANTMAGSAAYWLMSQADKGYATPSAGVGSVGAYTVHEDQSAHDAQQGRRFTYIHAGPHKVEGNPHEPLSEEGRNYRQDVIDELYGDFTSAIARGRNIDVSTVESNFGGGRVLSARKALEAGVIDAIVPYDSLMQDLQTQARPSHNVNVTVGGRIQSAVLSVDEHGKFHLESKEWEHSEPGTGSPPVPRTDQDGSDSKDIKSGSRRDVLPRDKSDPTAPQPNPGPVNTNVDVIESIKGGETTMEDTGTNTEIQQLAELLGVEPDKVLVTVQDLHTEATELSKAVNLSTQRTDFASQYPDVWKEHQALLAEGQEARARAFAKSVSSVCTQVNDELIPSKNGMSALAIETVAETHRKFATGMATLEDFEKSITTIMHGGILQYGEVGSSQTPELHELDTTTPQGVKNARQLFANKVAEVRKENSELTYLEAVDAAAQKWPDIAAAYRVAAPMPTSQPGR